MANKISVIMPVYNCERYLEAALASVLSQTGVEIEVIAVEDCSPDHSREILQKAAARDARIRPIYNEVNRGVAAVRNLALDAVTGEYVAFCDSDDIVPSGAYEALLSVMGEGDVAVGEFEDAFFDDLTDGNLEAAELHSCSIRAEDTQTSFGCLFSVCCLWTKLMRVSFLREHGLRFDESMSIGEDVVFLASLATKSPTCHTVHRSVYWHCHHNVASYRSLTHTHHLAAFQKHVECRQKLLDICRDIPECRDYVYLRFSADVVRNLHLISSAEEKREAFALFRAFLAGYDFENKPRFFRALTGVPYAQFVTMDADSYFEYCRTLTPRERVEAEFDCGMIGFRWILRYFACWLRYKLKKENR